MSVHIAPAFASWFPADACRSLEALATFLGMDLRGHVKRTKVHRSEWNNDAGEALTVYFKVYASRKRPWSGLGRRARALRECRNLRFFAEIGIPTPALVAWGSERRSAGLCSDRSFLITEAVPGARSLKEIWPSREKAPDEETRRAWITTLAQQTRRLHQVHFFHQDLKWRNLLIDQADHLVWIDCPAGYQTGLRWRRQRGRIKDLATLDLRAHQRCTEEDRRLFLQVYLECDDPTVVDQWANRVIAYRKRRFGK